MISKTQEKFIRSLHQKKFRDVHRKFIIEGPKMIEAAFTFSPDNVSQIYGTGTEFSFFPNFSIIEEKELTAISCLKHPQKHLAVCNYLPEIEGESDFYLVLDTVQDPGNLGTILRLAAWFGIKQIIASKETVDCYNPKVVQASMGALFNVGIRYLDLEDFLKNCSLPIYGAVLEGENLYASPLPKRGVLILGNEGNGISKELLPYVEHTVTIPKFGEGESLNVAMSAAIFLSEYGRLNLKA